MINMTSTIKKNITISNKPNFSLHFCSLPDEKKSHTKKTLSNNKTHLLVGQRMCSSRRKRAEH